MKAFLFTVLSLLACVILWKFSLIHALILALEFFSLFYFLERLGKKFVFLEILVFITITQWLFAPMIGQRFDVEMSVPYATYFEYALPATLIYLCGLTYPLWRQSKLDLKTEKIFNDLSIQYSNKQAWGILLVLIGLPCWIFQNSVSAALNYLFFLLAHLVMVGISLLMFTDYKWKWFWVAVGLMLLLSTTFLNGMIGSVIIWIFIIGVIYSVKRPVKIPFAVKIASLLIFVWVLTVLQAAKTEYRMLTWDIKKSEVSSRVRRDIDKDPQLFYELIKEKLLDLETLTEKNSIMALASRMNQGYLASHAMDYVPRRRAFGRGEVTISNTLTAFIPRILWKNKPVVGQAEYYKKYTGIQLTKYTSSTIGPLGDAYVDYGKWGMIFLGFFGWMIGSLYQFWVNKSMKDPSFILWFMVLYLGTISVTEVSVAGYINAVFKYILFIFAIRFVLRYVLKIKV